MVICAVTLTGMARSAILKELEICDFDKIRPACQLDDDNGRKEVSDFVMVPFSYNRAKR